MWSPTSPHFSLPPLSPLWTDAPYYGGAMGRSVASLRWPDMLRVTQAQHELTSSEAPFRGEDAIDLAASAEAVTTPFTEVRHRSRDVVALDYHETFQGAHGARCTTASIDRHWLTLRTAQLTPTCATGQGEVRSMCFDPVEADDESPGRRSASAPSRGAKVAPNATAKAAFTGKARKVCCPVYSTRWHYEDALLLTSDEEDLVRVYCPRPQSSSDLVLLSRSRVFRVAVSDARGASASNTRGGSGGGGGDGLLQLVSECVLTDDITVNALCADQWGSFGTLVGFSDGALRLVDARVPSRAAVVIETTAPQPPTTTGRRQASAAACVLSCCTLGDGNFRVVCGLGAANGEVAIADLRRPEMAESALRSRRVATRGVMAKRALLSGTVCAPTGSPIADMQLLPPDTHGGAGPALCVGMVDVCGSVRVMSVADLEHQRVRWSGRRSRGPPTRSRFVEEEEDEDEQNEEGREDVGIVHELPLPSQRASVPPPPHRASRHSVTNVLVLDEEEVVGDDEGRHLDGEVAQAREGHVDANGRSAEGAFRRRTVSFSPATTTQAPVSLGNGLLSGRLPSPEVVASAWLWHAPRSLASRSPSFGVSSPLLRPSRSRRAAGPTPILMPPQPQTAPSTTAAATETRSARSASTPTAAAAPTAAMNASASRPSPQPSLGILSSTDLRCAVLSGQAWTGRPTQSILVATQPSSATTTWYDPERCRAVGELVPLVRGVEAAMDGVLRQGQYIVGLSTLGPLLCVETARGGTYCILPDGA